MTRRHRPLFAPLFSLAFAVWLTVGLGISTAAYGADDPVSTATKLYEKRRYEQAARVLEDALARPDAERRAQAQLVLGMIYLRNADLHEALARAAAAAELDYLDKLLKTSTEGRSRYARLYLAEALFARGDMREAARHFEQVRADPAIESRYRAIASIGLGSALWAQRDAERAQGLWAGAGGTAEITLARAAAQARARVADVKSLRRVADDTGRARELSPRARRYLIEIYLAAGAPDKALAVARAADLGTASYVERFKVAQGSKGTAKSIAFYDLALLTDLAQLYRELARRQLEQAADDARMKPSAEYYLAEALNGLGANDQALTFVQAFLARPQAPAQYRERARARQALIAHRQGRGAEAESTWTAMAEQSSDPEVLADIVLGCADAQARCAKVLARVGQVTEAGDGRRYQRLNFALGSYYLRKKDYARAIAYMEAGRDKSNKNKIEANDPEMLAGLAEAYYRTKKFSEGLEIFFEMSQEFPVVRQIQEAVQGVYSMEQRSAGDVRIL
ncbi:MAG TPA: tetratricopeptide repeat protein [Burkholderiales bacterium]|nr:tetratricopeptide repeat protein [Burkholderiales bacterium]